MHNWKRRFIVLNTNENTLYYYKTQNDWEREKKARDRVIVPDGSDALIVDNNDSKNYRWGIVIRDPSKMAILVLAAETEEDRRGPD